MNIEELLIQFCKNTWGKDFEFRKYQKEVILDILEYQNKNPEGSYILDAPTGSGKSIIGMCVAGVLEAQGLIGYILTSDLGLQQQYADDFKNANINWRTVKGKRNYDCHINGQTADVGDCIITKTPASKLDCYVSCDYYNARMRAQSSPITLLNYSYWLMQMNYVLPKIQFNAPFDHRDFIIADEAHKVNEIVQSHFSPVISKYSNIKLEKLNLFVSDNNLGSLGFLTETWTGELNTLIQAEATLKISKYLLKLENTLKSIITEGKKISKSLKADYSKDKMPKFIIYGMGGFDYAEELYNKIKDFNNIISDTSHEEIVKVYNENAETVTLKTINENKLMQEYFHDVSNFQLYMSATITGKDAFIEDVNIPGARYVHMTSTWDFDKSPIYVWNGKKMSYSLMEQNLPWMIDKIEQVLDKHADQRGIIHTGSYKFANDIHVKLKKKFKDRVMIYKGSSEKNEMLEYLKRNTDTVIMGPSITEGLNLYDDLSRFQILAKVPFPSLADKFTKRKMVIKKSWYNWKTINSIIQGIGRSIRNKNDYAITYILDGNFIKLYFGNKNMFPPEFKKRIKIIKN